MRTPFELMPLYAPEFVNSPQLELALEQAELKVPANLCGARRNELVALMAAHILRLASFQNGTPGEVQSLTQGNQSITFAKGSKASTSYLSEYNRIARGCIGTPLVSPPDLRDFCCGGNYRGRLLRL